MSALSLPVSTVVTLPYYDYSDPSYRAAGDLGDPLPGASTECDVASCIACSCSCDSEHVASVFPSMAALELAGNPSYLDQTIQRNTIQ